jgi:hypothetical protein
MLEARLPAQWAQLRPGPLGWLTLAVALYAGIAASLAPSTFGAIYSYYLGQIAVLPVLLVIGLPIAAVIAAPRAPATFILTVLRRRSLAAILAILVFCLGVSGFTTFKLQIPAIIPFYADPWFAAIDAALHFGDPGLHAHAILPAWAEWPLAYAYGKIWLLQWFGTLLFAAFMPAGPVRTRYFWASGLTTLLVGTVLATLLSSVGPIFYEAFYGSDRFAPLIAAAADSAAGSYLAEISVYLMASYQSGSAAPGTGISAMPSMHVALATLNACFLTSLNRRLAVPAWAFVALIQFGSVYLTWHYAIDGYLSMLVVGLVWWGTGRRLLPVRSQDPGTSRSIA